MHGIFILFVLLVFKMIIIDGYVLARGCPNSVERHFPSLEPRKNDSNSKDLYPKKVRKLLVFLRKHQHDEAELKQQIKTLLANFQAGQMKEADMQLSKEKICLCKTKTVRAILTMLNLSPKQTELLEKIVILMKGHPNKCTSTKRDKIEHNDDLDVGLPTYYSDVGEINQNSKLIHPKENGDAKKYGSDLALNMDEIKDIAREVEQIIKSHSDQTEEPVEPSPPENDVSTIVTSSEPSGLEEILF